MTARQVSGALVQLLDRIAAGRLEAQVDGSPFVILDGKGRNLTVQLDPLLGEGKEVRSLLRQSHLSLWETRGIPSALARSGWHVSFRNGPDELLRLGRGESLLTGHVHVSLTELWKLRRSI